MTNNIYKNYTKIIVFLFSFLFYISSAFCADVTFQWGESSGQVDGYRIYWGKSHEGPYTNQLCEVNSVTLAYTAVLDERKKYYLICRAFNNYGESDNSKEVYWVCLSPNCPKGVQHL